MKTNIGIAVMAVITGLAMSAAAAELNGLKAADVAAISMEAAIPVPDVKPAEGGASLKTASDILAAGGLPGGCALEMNSFRPSPYPPMSKDSLNVGIIKGGDYTDILMVGELRAAPVAGGMMYFYESISTEGADWVDHRVKSSFTLVAGTDGRVKSVSIEQARESNGLLGSGWKVTESVVCR